MKKNFVVALALAIVMAGSVAYADDSSCDDKCQSSVWHQIGHFFNCYHTGSFLCIF